MDVNTAEMRSPEDVYHEAAEILLLDGNSSVADSTQCAGSDGDIGSDASGICKTVYTDIPGAI